MSAADGPAGGSPAAGGAPGVPAPGADPHVLSLLLTWFSPALPIGTFAYSHGLEALFDAGWLPDGAVAEAAATAALEASGRNDAILLAHAFRAARRGDAGALDDLRRLALALAPSAERRAETIMQGNAFAGLVAAVWPHDVAVPPGDLPLPVATGIAGAAHGVPLEALTHAHLTAFAATLVSAAVRLVPLGQTEGQRITHRLAPTVARVAAEALAASLDDLGGAAVGLDIASMRHEVQVMRLFRS